MDKRRETGNPEVRPDIRPGLEKGLYSGLIADVKLPHQGRALFFPLGTARKEVRWSGLPDCIIHRSYLVNLAHIDAISGGRMKVKGKELPVAATRKEEFLKQVVYKNLISK